MYIYTSVCDIFFLHLARTGKIILKRSRLLYDNMELRGVATGRLKIEPEWIKKGSNR